MAERAGKMIKAEINKEPTKFIAKTITKEINMAMSILYRLVLKPVALVNPSSNVNAKMR